LSNTTRSRKNVEENPFVGKWNFFEKVSVDGEDDTPESIGFDIYFENGFYTHTWMRLNGPKVEGPPQTLEDYAAIVDYYSSDFGQYTYSIEDSTLTWTNEGNLFPYERDSTLTFKIQIVKDTLFYRLPNHKWIYKCKRER
jgi:hypothetical protein